MLKTDDPDEEIPELVHTGSIIRDFDNDRTAVPHTERYSDKYYTS